jgi:G:T/U-mismatch repair DNA glycosylase
VRPVPDIVAPDLRLLFVGINPSLFSSAVGHHFASRGNPFWRLLHASGLTPALLRPDEDRRLLELGLGVTNGCDRPTRSAAELSPAEQREGARLLEAKVEALRPRLVVIVGLTLTRLLLPGSDERGPGPRRATFGGAPVFVVPNPSGLNQAYPGFESKLVWFRKLAEAVGPPPRASAPAALRRDPLVRVLDGALPPAAHARLARAVRDLGTENLSRTYQTTFWFGLGAPATLPEAAVLALRARVPALRRPGIAGVEWWLSRMRTSDVQVDFHQDRDEARFARTGEVVHPAIGSVLFLNRCRGGHLAVTDAPANEDNPARAPDELGSLDLVRPRPNRLAVFPGDATHGVLDANGEVPHRRLHPPAPLRLALVMNWWTHRPEGVPEFPAAGRYEGLRVTGGGWRGRDRE